MMVSRACVVDCGGARAGSRSGAGAGVSPSAAVPICGGYKCS